MKIVILCLITLRSEVARLARFQPWWADLESCWLFFVHATQFIYFLDLQSTLVKTEIKNTKIKYVLLLLAVSCLTTNRCFVGKLCNIIPLLNLDEHLVVMCIADNIIAVSLFSSVLKLLEVLFIWIGYNDSELMFL